MTSHVDGDPAELARPASSSLSSRARAEHELVAGLGGQAGGGGADPRRGAGDQEHTIHGSYRYPSTMLADRARIEVQAGRGGDGSMSFRRESRVPKGGPDGGDGGRGGDVVLRCDDSLRDLQSFRRRGQFKAARGGHGLGKLMSGADGDRLVIPVPPGHDRRALGRAHV